MFASTGHRYSVPETTPLRIPDKPLTPLYCRVPWTICIHARGADAEDFLRGQLTQNPPAPGDAGCSLAGWSDARGRVRAVFRVLRRADRLLLVTEREHAAAVLGKLRMYVLRARVELEPDDLLANAAVVGDAAAWLASRRVPLAAAPGAAASTGELFWLRLGPELLHVVGPAAEVDRLGANLAEGPTEHAELAEIRLGIPRIGAALAERYLPQMLNLDRLDAVSFDKGCYPGQEVIARLHHLGQVKRRMRRFTGDAPGVVPAPGTSLVDEGGTPVGEAVRAASVAGSMELLAVVQLDAAASPLYLDGEEKIALAVQPLPYERS